jgi:hypothetical protein
VIACFSTVLAACGSVRIELPEFKVREALPPIAIPPAACPALREVQATADRAAAVWYKTEPWVADGLDWRPFQYELAFNLPSFAAALERASEETPEPLAADLRAVHKQVVIGMRELPDASSFADYEIRTHGALYKGVVKLLDASDRVGTACGFERRPLYSTDDAFKGWSA